MLMMRSVTAGLSLTLITMVSAMMPYTAHGAVGRIEGNFGVSPTGAATYDIPISLPPGPKGVQPNLSLSYNSNGGPGILGVGWNLEGLSSIERCNKTVAQDGAAFAVSLSTSDGYCLDGKRLRLTSGIYGADGSVYQTEIADFSQITAHGSAGSGPKYFTVKAKNGLTYEYGYNPDSRAYGVSLNGTKANTPYAWMLDKVVDRDSNNYVIQYYGGESGSKGIALPQMIQYTPVTSGSSNYIYTVTFSYTTRLAQNANTRFRGIIGYTINSSDTTYNPYQQVNPNLLKTITVSASGNSSLVNQYNLSYDNSAATTVSRLTSIQQCGLAATGSGTDCLSPTTVTYNEGSAELNPTSNIINGTEPIKFLAARDFNGDGRDDILYRVNGYGPDYANLFVSLSSNAGGAASSYSTPIALPVVYMEPILAKPPPSVTSIPTKWWSDGDSAIGFADLLGTGHTDILVPDFTSHQWVRLSWNSVTNSFDSNWIQMYGSASNETGYPYLNTVHQGVWRDVNGDGKADFVDLECDVNTNEYYLRVNLNISTENAVKLAAHSPGDETRYDSAGDPNLLCGMRYTPANVYLGRSNNYYSYGQVWLADNPDETPNTSALPKKMDFNGDGYEDILVRTAYVSFTSGFSTGWDKTNNPNVADGSAPLISFVYKNNGAPVIDPVDGKPLVFYGLGSKILNVDRTYYANFNEDACTDLVTRETDQTNGSRWRAYLSACNGASSSAIEIGQNISVVGVADWDGDGQSDVVISKPNGGVQVAYSTGNGLSNPIDAGTGITTIGSAFLMNVTGNLAWDIGSATDYRIAYNLRKSGTRPDVLTTISDGYGNTNLPTYVSTVQSNCVCAVGGVTLVSTERQVTQPLSVVGSVLTTDGTGSNYTLTYNYEYPLEDILRGFEGFKSQSVSDSRTNAPVIKTSYLTAFPFTGMTSNRTVLQSGGITPILIEGNQAGSITLNSTPYSTSQFVYTSNSTRDNYSNGAKTFSTSANYHYDGYGNLLSSESHVYGPGAVPEDWKTVVTNIYAAADTVNWCLDLPQLTTIYKTASQGLIVREAPITRTTSFTPDPSLSKCRIKSREVEPDPSPYHEDFGVLINYSYDGFGNVSSETVTGNNTGTGQKMTPRTTQTGFDITGRFPTSVTNPMNENSTAFYDPVQGVLTMARDPNLLQTTTLTDNFGRVTRVTFPDGTYKTVDRTDCSGNPSDSSYCGVSDLRLRQVLKTFGSDNSLTSEQHVLTDMLGRTRFVESKGLDGSFTTVQTKYDALGHVSSQSIPYVASQTSTPLWVNYSYDAQGRVTREERPVHRGDSAASSGDTSVTNTAYYPLGKESVDSQGRIKRMTFDPIGRLTLSCEYDECLVYQYDAFGSLTAVYQNGNGYFQSTASYGYGLDAYRTQMVDADLGTWNYKPNSLGEVASYTDAKSVTINQTFDALSRPLTRYVSGVSAGAGASTSTSEGMVTWTWGGSAANHEIGKLKQIYQVGGTTESYYYNGYGQLQKRSILSDASSTYDYVYSYNAAGSLDTLTYPDISFGSDSAGILQLKHGYQNGILQQVRDNISGTVFWQANAVNALGEITNEQLGNGVTTTRSFDAATGWLNNIKSGQYSAFDKQSESYLYDKIGNLIQRANDKQTVTESFCYDGVYRLVRSALSGDPTCQNNKNLELTYDQYGRITSRSDLANNTAWSYDLNHVHAVSHIGHSGFDYSYDANGNMIISKGNPISWNAYNLPVYIASSGSISTISLFYDGNQQRWKSIFDHGDHPTETTYYIGGLMEKVALAGQDKVTYRQYIYGGGGSAPVAVISKDVRNSDSGVIPGNTQTNYFLFDQQGSVSSILNADGSTLVNESYTAYGDRRDPTTWNGSASSDDLSVSAGVTRQGYTWQTALGNMGLNHMNGRVQDAITGVFMSPDPYISEPGNPQNYNRYSYVYNNPMSHTDPSGFVTIGYGSCEPKCEEVIVTATYSHNGEYFPGDWFQYYGHFLPPQGSLSGSPYNSSNVSSANQNKPPPATKVSDKTSLVTQTQKPDKCYAISKAINIFSSAVGGAVAGTTGAALTGNLEAIPAAAFGGALIGGVSGAFENRFVTASTAVGVGVGSYVTGRASGASAIAATASRLATGYAPEGTSALVGALGGAVRGASSPGAFGAGVSSGLAAVGGISVFGKAALAGFLASQLTNGVLQSANNYINPECSQ